VIIPIANRTGIKMNLSGYIPLRNEEIIIDTEIVAKKLNIIRLSSPEIFFFVLFSLESVWAGILSGAIFSGVLLST
jgi:hypothetical protein